MRAGTIALALLLGVGATRADDFYRWHDGGLHRDPPARTEPAATAREPGAPPVRLRFEPHADAIEAWADNALAGPVEVELRAERGPVPGIEPALPLRTVLRSGERRRIARVPNDADARVVLVSVRGAPGTRVDDAVYGFPLAGTTLRIEQGWGGGWSHRDEQNRYAVDFGADAGTPVRAARDGIVMEVEADHDGTGLDRTTDLGRANFVRIVHADGSMALYAHLQHGGVRVRPGQQVAAGQIIGLVGATGFATGPHLHFVVQANRGMRLASIRFRMIGPQGALRFTEAP